MSYKASFVYSDLKKMEIYNWNIQNVQMISGKYRLYRKYDKEE